MRTTTAASPRHSAPKALVHPECPVVDGTARSQLDDCVRASKDLSRAMLHFLDGKSREEKAAWLKTSVATSRAMFQPWSMEILFVVAALKRARFSELENLLGISSRTLSDKLRALRDAGLVDREVFDEQPVRIEYFLTRHGRAATALATPLFTHLNVQAVEAARAPAGAAGP